MFDPLSSSPDFLTFRTSLNLNQQNNSISSDDIVSKGFIGGNDLSTMMNTMSIDANNNNNNNNNNIDSNNINNINLNGISLCDNKNSIDNNYEETIIRTSNNNNNNSSSSSKANDIVITTTTTTTTTISMTSPTLSSDNRITLYTPPPSPPNGINYFNSSLSLSSNNSSQGVFISQHRMIAMHKISIGQKKKVYTYIYIFNLLFI
ncbi:hypothetical protein DDB_G0286107 [Dictyostelium discoideum AX4]|uniref:Uncharacterized protein DDB_G0286107 n=1 Tax=Dictyostelium discoideum TaxID=44689 RepID=Y8785_DICDI|nr:hypothetical protein DDB_G0286107 [Dictyostelium discoideum AX4]Q54MC8.1 RecName: Full=Uncharacterized protein DDB_G0286107 [Dictyostelium discoideum]EAL64432.1 hypothetical protein DDB_G0286107 [Dictyostelium discoideum AX4]|eukprot:XP_637906.1 hypothetical protein DDB_G0286107 [Dictyostelium discoideum AX4]